MPGPFWPLLAAGLLAATLSDLRTRRIPNALNLGILGAGFVAQLWLFGWAGLQAAALGAVAGFALIIVPFAVRLYRGGDAKLVMAVGAWLGPVGIGWMFLWGAVLGGVVGIVMVLFARREERQEVGANLKVAAWTVSLPQVDKERPAHRHVPMALAFSLGAVIALRWHG